MTVYIEYVILDNFIMDYILLYAVAKTLKTRAGWARLSCGALLGTVFAALLPLLELGDLPLLSIKLLVGFFMSMFACPPTGKRILVAYLLFMCYTFALGGAAIGLLFLMKADMRSAAALIYDFDVPIGVIVGACALCLKLVLDLAKYLQKKRSVYPLLRQIELEYKGKRFAATAFADTGNRLYDDDGSPVLVIGKRLAKKMVLKGAFESAAEGEFKVKEYFTAHSSSSSMVIFKAQKLLIYFEDKPNIIENVSVGAVSSSFEGLGCDALLHCDMIV
ncbi:MAG: hypothetical protein GX304_05925 [Clostridiales bacterium]|nr:hypothetical protein [Clostridiales bacterium]